MGVGLLEAPEVLLEEYEPLVVVEEVLDLVASIRGSLEVLLQEYASPLEELAEIWGASVVPPLLLLLLLLLLPPPGPGWG